LVGYLKVFRKLGPETWVASDPVKVQSYNITEGCEKNNTCWKGWTANAFDLGIWPELTKDDTLALQRLKEPITTWWEGSCKDNIVIRPFFRVYHPKADKPIPRYPDGGFAEEIQVPFFAPSRPCILHAQASSERWVATSVGDADQLIDFSSSPVTLRISTPFDYGEIRFINPPGLNPIKLGDSLTSILKLDGPPRDENGHAVYVYTVEYR
jgi:hypothetical protein